MIDDLHVFGVLGVLCCIYAPSRDCRCSVSRAFVGC